MNQRNYARNNYKLSPIKNRGKYFSFLLKPRIINKIIISIR